MGKGDKSNPMESFRKKEKKREAQKNKENKFKSRAQTLAKQDSTSIDSQIRQIEAQVKSGTADKKTIAKKKQLLDAKQLVEERKAAYEATDAAQIEKYRQSMTQEATKTVAQLEAENAHLFPNPEDSIYYHPTLNPYGAPPPGAKPVFRSSFNAANQLEGPSNPIQGLLTASGDAPIIPSLPVLGTFQPVPSERKEDDDEIDRELDLSKVPLPPGPPPRFLQRYIPPLPPGPPPFLPPHLPHLGGPPFIPPHMGRGMIPPPMMGRPPFPPHFQPPPPPHAYPHPPHPFPQYGRLPPPPGMGFVPPPPGMSAPPAPPLKRQRVTTPSEPEQKPQVSAQVLSVPSSMPTTEDKVEEEEEGPIAGPSRPPTMDYSSVTDVYPPPPPVEYEEEESIYHREEVEEQDEGIAMMVPVSLRVRREQPKAPRQRPVVSFPAKPKEKDEAFDEFMEDMKGLGAV
eukprot:TRINITY_DN6367_c0_g2_i1.p1 TRINITY_DN6367_c0_g2~~TRINITY_DN6367_c0_g2_i1.p1  ORF type:complete len:455 (-),score=172.13 TRINITY_DN6367_c0_g2_i1:1177-2541(-)